MSAESVTEGGILLVLDVEEVIGSGILLIYLLHSLSSLKQVIINKQVQSLGLVELNFLLDDHDQLVDVERLQYQNSELDLCLLVVRYVLQLGPGSFLDDDGHLIRMKLLYHLSLLL